MRQLLILLLISVSAHAQLVGTWSFQSIEDSIGREVKPCEPTDKMFLNADSSFSYSIAKLDLQARGTWSAQNDTLSLFYFMPTDTVRHYRYSFNYPLLELEENNIFYSFISDSTQVRPAKRLLPEQSRQSEFRPILKLILALLAVLIITILLFRRKRSNKF